MPGCATPAIPKVEDEDVLAYLKAENAYFEAAMAPHQALVETLFEEMKGRIKEDESLGPGPDGDWLYWWAFKPGAQYRTWYRRPVAGGDGPDRLRRAGRGRGQGIFPPRRARGQPRRPAAPRPWSTTTARSGSSCASATSPPARTSRRSPRSASAAGLDQRQQGRRLHRGQRALAQLPRPLPPARHAASPRTSRSTRRPRSSASRSASRKSQDRSLIFIATGDNATSEVALRPRRRPGRAADPDLAAQARSANMRSTRRTASCGS